MQEQTEITKHCSGCQQQRHISFFYAKNKNKKWTRSLCKICICRQSTEQRRKRRIENPEIEKLKDKLYRQKNPKRIWASQVIREHRRKGITILIGQKELQEIIYKIENCYICNCLLSWGNNGHIRDYSPSFDRIDYKGPLSKENCQIVCFKCNATKRNRTMKEFIDYCTMVSTKFTNIYLHHK